MSANIIVENINTSKDTVHYPIQLKAGLAKIFTVYDTYSCIINDKFIICDNPPNLVAFETMPTKYSVKFNIGYEVNQLADQDGNVEKNCTKAFVNQIDIAESFSYNECAADVIDFDNMFNIFTQELLGGTVSLNTTKTTVSSALNLISGILNNTTTMSHFITNTKILRFVDEESGIYKVNKIITRKLYQSSIVNLDGDNFILDTLSLETDKNSAFAVVSLEIKTVSIKPLITLADENPVKIDLDIESDCTKI